MKKITKKIAKNLPVSIKVRKPRYYYQDIDGVYNEDVSKNIELAKFEGVDYEIDGNFVVFKKKRLWNREISPEYRSLLAPRLGGDLKYVTLGRKLQYDVKGSPTIVDNVVSNFTSGNYITNNYIFNPNNSSWVWQVKFKQTTAYTGDVQYIMNTNRWDNGPYITITTDGKITACIVDGSAKNVFTGFASEFAVEVNKDYWVRMEFDGNETYSVKYSTDGEVFNLMGEVVSSSKALSTNILWLGRCEHNTYFRGEIDLNETYIKVGNEYMFGKNTPGLVEVNGALDGFVYKPNTDKIYTGVTDTECVLLRDIDEDKEGYAWVGDVSIPKGLDIKAYLRNYTVVGSITYNLFFHMSASSAGGSIKTSEMVLMDSNKDKLFIARVKTGSDTNYHDIFWTSEEPSQGFGTYSGKWFIWAGNNILGGTMEYNTWYWVILSQTSSKSTLYYLKDEGQYSDIEDLIEKNFHSMGMSSIWSVGPSYNGKLFNQSVLFLGSNFKNAEYWKNAIDLTNVGIYTYELNDTGRGETEEIWKPLRGIPDLSIDFS